jgi:drug/metabolite transporter (DMT)-like permease
LRITPARYGLLVIGIAGLSLAGVFYKLASAPILVVVAWRMLIGAAVMVPVAFVMQSRRALPRVQRSDIAWSITAGVFFCADLTLWAVSLRSTSVASAALFVSTDPIYVALFAALLFGERPTPPAVAGIALGIIGIVVVGAGDLRVSGAALGGDALALAAALAETVYLLIGRHVRRRVDASRYVLTVYTACAAGGWIVLWIARASPQMSMHDMMMAAAVALSATVIGHTLVSLSLGYMPAALVAVTFLAQPMLAALFALAVLHQPIPLATIAGGTIALLGIGIVAYANERTTSASEPTAT